MAKQKRPKKQRSPLPFIFWAVFAYVAGFPIWIVFILVLIGFLLWQVQKSQQGSNKLPPLPPAESDVSQTEAEPAREPANMASKPVPEKLVPAPQTYREPLPKETPPPWVQADYQPYPKAESAAPVASSASAQRKTATSSGYDNRTSGAYRIGSRLHPLARNLRSRHGARQAIIAMTVLGPPRSLQPYELDPTQQGDIVPPRAS
jgi:cytoskeletal protein RodZ